VGSGEVNIFGIAVVGVWMLVAAAEGSRRVIRAEPGEATRSFAPVRLRPRHLSPPQHPPDV